MLFNNGSERQKVEVDTLSFSVTRLDNAPIDNIPKLVDRAGAVVAIVDIVGVFPYIEAEERYETICKRCPRIALRDDV